MRKSIRRSKKRRSKRRSKRKSKRRSVRMRWISPGGTVHPNRDGMNDGAGRSIAQMIHGYTHGYKPEHIKDVSNLVKEGFWNEQYTRAMGSDRDFIRLLKAALDGHNDKAIIRLVQIYRMNKLGWMLVIEMGYWSDSFANLIQGYDDVSLMSMANRAERSRNYAALSSINKILR